MKLNYKIILASQSPRRKDLLNQLGIKNIELVKHTVDETKYEFKNPLSKSIMDLAQMKAESVAGKFKDINKIIIAGDTVVFRAGQIFHKTKSKDKIKNYLKTLSLRKHFVYGGICVVTPKRKVLRRFIISEVYFNKIEESDLTDQVLSDGIDKAGGYAIQNYGGRFVRKIRGSYTNIVGISIPELYKILKSLEF